MNSWPVWLGAALALLLTPAAAQTPRVDHHTHLWSLEASAVMVPPLLPEVALPPPLAEFMAARTAPSDATTLAQLYTEDARFLDPRGQVWIGGRDAIRRLLADAIPGYGMLANGYRITGDAASITGTITRRDGDAISHRRSYQLSLVREADAWRIAAESWSSGPPPVPGALSVETLIAELDQAGIQRAAVFSAAHLFASALGAPRADERALVRRENVWLAERVAQYPQRLIGLCSMNPLRDYAAEELRFCVRELGLRGLKLIFADSGVDLTDAEHRRRLRTVFRAANALRVPIVVHVQGRDGYGPVDTEHMLALAAAAPDIPIQIAHLAGGGPGLDAEPALAAYVEAVQRNDPRMRNVYLEVSSVVVSGTPTPELEHIAGFLRGLGVERVIFGSDRSGAKNEAPGVAWASFRRLPLTDAEFEVVARNSLYE